MISSRCDTRLPDNSGRTLSDLRHAVKAAIEKETLFGQKFFDVTINEDAPPNGSRDSWETCMKWVDECDLLLVLFNGDAGWRLAEGGGDTGICHGEFSRALGRAPGKLLVLRVGAKEDVEAFLLGPDKRFQADVVRADRFRGEGTTLEELVQQATHAVLHATAELVELGTRETRRGQYHVGQALEWSKLSYNDRAGRICDVLGEAIVQNGGSRLQPRAYANSVGQAKIGFIVHAIPSAITVSASREIVGRPFLRDHNHLKQIGEADGPVHLIGCNRTVTETQAADLLGFPDAIIIKGPFGVFVADEVQKVQFVLLENCRDEALTRVALQRFLSWLDTSGEGGMLAQRAAARTRIVQAVQAELP